MKVKPFIFFALFATIAVTGHAELKISGSMRNDAIVSFMTNREVYNDILETKFIIQRKADDWKFYSDIRLKLLFGQSANMIENAAETFAYYLGSVEPNLAALSGSMFPTYFVTVPRTFIKFYTGIGDFSLGKTYVNFGNIGVFNPLEMNKSVTFTDLNYEKEGILGVEYDFMIGALSGGRIYVSPDDPLSNTGVGMSVYGNVGSFDIGLVLNRKQYNANIIGAYFKGDLIVGVHGGYAFHINDWGEDRFNEANLGIDYSFFKGKLIPSLTFYYCEAGAESVDDYVAVSDEDRYFQAKYYLYGNLTYAHDEFFSAGVDCFVNLIDSSGMVMPNVGYLLFDGLKFTLLGMYLWKDGDVEFSSDLNGEVSVVLRCEASL